MVGGKPAHRVPHAVADAARVAVRVEHAERRADIDVAHLDAGDVHVDETARVRRLHGQWPGGDRRDLAVGPAVDAELVVADVARHAGVVLRKVELADAAVGHRQPAERCVGLDHRRERMRRVPGDRGQRRHREGVHLGIRQGELERPGLQGAFVRRHALGGEPAVRRADEAVDADGAEADLDTRFLALDRQPGEHRAAPRHIVGEGLVAGVPVGGGVDRRHPPLDRGFDRLLGDGRLDEQGQADTGDEAGGSEP